MTSDEIYAAIWECLEPFERGLQDAERKVALDSCVDAAARKIAARLEAKRDFGSSSLEAGIASSAMFQDDGY